VISSSNLVLLGSCGNGRTQISHSSFERDSSRPAKIPSVISLRSKGKLVVVPRSSTTGNGLSGSCSSVHAFVGSLSSRLNRSERLRSTSGIASTTDHSAYFHADSGQVPILLGGRFSACWTRLSLRIATSIAADAEESRASTNPVPLTHETLPSSPSRFRDLRTRISIV
jgi:hypothetical protein